MCIHCGPLNPGGSRFILCLWLLFSLVNQSWALRTTLWLDGQWEVADSVDADAIPKQFSHTVQVPGLVNLAKPSFKDVDLFDSMELIANRIRQGKLPESARIQTAGVPHQDRNYFWYRKSLRVPQKFGVAILKINKAQFGTAVWLNGAKLGEYPGCFSASYFTLTDYLHRGSTNELVIRIGAHPAVLPVTYPTGTDFEKLKWTPGIYDSVSVILADNPIIETVQVAPRLTPPGIQVQTRVKNYGLAATVTLDHKIRTWKAAASVATAETKRLQLASGEVKTVTQFVALPNAHLWSPEDPFLYALESATGGDTMTTRFGMREFRSDAKTGRFYLNGKIYYLRGSNITFHRFLEDPQCRDLPWNETWLRRLLIDIPHQMHWNAFRLCIGPVPDRWLELADEAGLLLQNEFFVWTGAPSWDSHYARHWDETEMVRQFSDWMRDGWNHPSVAIWDANNETLDPLFGEKVIPQVRKLDLSNRPWENSYNPPAGPEDPIEYHPYLFQPSASGKEIKFHLTDLERMDGKAAAWHFPKEPHPILINEYGWLWLNRDGTPTLLTDTLYPRLLGTNATAAERFAFDAYALAAKTEFWRAHRQLAGVLHFVYLTCSYPGVFTSDHFIDVKSLQLEPHFADYLGQACQPLGVYLEAFPDTLPAGNQRSFKIKLVNDESRVVAGELVVSLESWAGKELVRTNQPFQVEENGNATLEAALTIPDALGKCVIKATAKPQGAGAKSPTVSRRWSAIQSP